MHHENENKAWPSLPTSMLIRCCGQWGRGTYKQRAAADEGLKLSLEYSLLLSRDHTPDRNQLTAVLKSKKFGLHATWFSPRFGRPGEWGRCPTYRKLNKYTQQTLHLNSLIANICCLSHICFIFKTGRWLEDNKLFWK